MRLPEVVTDEVLLVVEVVVSFSVWLMLWPVLVLVLLPVTASV